jgi:hypothetical protein
MKWSRPLADFLTYPGYRIDPRKFFRITDLVFIYDVDAWSSAEHPTSGVRRGTDTRYLDQ